MLIDLIKMGLSQETDAFPGSVVHSLGLLISAFSLNFYAAVVKYTFCQGG